jgi:mono/diheme cytochrome c family protein
MEKFTELNGQYIFADNYSGKVWKMPATPGQKLEPEVLARATQVAQRGISSVTAGPDGRILVTTLGSAGEENGRVWSLVERGSAEDTGEEEPAQSGGAIAMSDTIETFNSACGRCHGITGQADGPDSAELGGRFPNFASAAYHRQRDDDTLFRIINDGGAENGLREEMPPWRDILAEPEIRALVKHLRNLQQPGDEPAYVMHPEKPAVQPANN